MLRLLWQGAGSALACASVIALALPTALYGQDAPAEAGDSTGQLKRMSIEDLLALEVTSVSKRPEKLADTASAIQVITHEDIRRAGVTSLPEALRLATNLQVARIDPVQYAVSARGFNNAIGNKLLVLIDGRTVYTPLFSGVFWDQQDVMLEDVERIEVVSGPGATLWGANAVNGVINIITWPARDTQGVLVGLGGGGEERSLALRYGGGVGAGPEGGHLRVYAKATQLEETRASSGAVKLNSWDRAQGGFRFDRPVGWSGADGTFTLQGDAYEGKSEHRGFVGAIEITEVHVSGANLLARWSAQLDGGSDVRLQAYFDHAERDEVVLFRPTSDIVDVEFQQGLRGGAHDVLWGAGYRHARDDVANGLILSFIPSSRRLDWWNLFLRDRIALGETFELTAGLKIEHNDYTGVEHLPSLHLAWKPTDTQLFWSSVSRAVRAPARLDREVFVPVNPPFIVAGGPSFVSEVAEVVELGWRAQPLGGLSWSTTLFHHDWERLRSGQLPPGVLENRIYGEAYGAELAINWQVTSAWRLAGGATGLRKDLRLEEGSTDPIGTANPNLANDPEYQWTVRSSWRFAHDHDLDVSIRQVADLPNPAVSGYTAVDARYAWRVRPSVELSVTGANLFDPDHIEFGAAASASVVERSVYGKLLWEF